MRKSKIAVLVLALIGLTLIVTGCEGYAGRTGNRIVYGSDVQTFNYAYVYLDGNKVVEGTVMQWRDYDESDVVQVLMNGKYYLTHYSNVILVSDPDLGSVSYSYGDWN